MIVSWKGNLIWTFDQLDGLVPRVRQEHLDEPTQLHPDNHFTAAIGDLVPRPRRTSAWISVPWKRCENIGDHWVNEKRLRWWIPSQDFSRCWMVKAFDIGMEWCAFGCWDVFAVCRKCRMLRRTKRSSKKFWPNSWSAVEEPMLSSIHKFQWSASCESVKEFESRFCS